ncbi:Proline dehydrogenase [Thermodesulfobium narugense DSM 14796]|uniref:proline dehydrogenase n=2 Tax=Thermodesulfobium narugense TaxID=184064 RepID=M1E897_9BACT|nr:Proline dehydrogenase [Thermodesulfobium narugense DSM 14796]
MLNNIFNFTISNTIDYVPEQIIDFFSKKYVSGPSLSDAVKTTIDLNSKGMMSTIDVLGEFVQNEDQTIFFRNECIKVLETIKEESLNANLSLKPTQMGLAINKALCYENIRKIVRRAKELDNFVRIDMENSPYTTDTLKMYKLLREEFPGHVGTVLQAYLRRTIDDIDKLSDKNLNIRLCKGIYVESYKIAYKNPELINENYIYCLEKLFDNKAYVGIATHDEKLIFHAMKLIRKYNLQPNEYEFQMLLGIGDELRDFILSKKHRLRIYVPYGKEWLSYVRRRLKENPNIIKTALGLKL